MNRKRECGVVLVEKKLEQVGGINNDLCRARLA